MSTLGVFSTVGDAMSTVGDTMMSVGEYHEYIGGCSVHWDFLTNSIVFPTCIMISPWCTHDIPQCTSTHDIPTVSMISLSVLNIPHCTAPPRCTAETLCRVVSHKKSTIVSEFSSSSSDTVREGTDN